ncbi:hypothetical protein CPB84DRAFT_1752625 [Gymnopilus junonius]|uniref:Uncharacterized protein n=1 Tax=Gymnopilus junonius TaxID=109634 RepID=A0A9P5TGQ7_GYMJU|nr:hypothetical protein CPB84DRAFT_1752625 [Gymnopilus junonius]
MANVGQHDAMLAGPSVYNLGWGCLDVPLVPEEDEALYDDIGEHLAAGDSDLPAKITLEGSKIERQILVLLSNGNVNNDEQLGSMELDMCEKQAKMEIIQICDIIADLFFQYKHVMRGAVRCSLCNNGQHRVKALHEERTLHACMYSRCCQKLEKLKCGPKILNVLKVLSEDLQVSTAVLNPNLPASSSIKLSWLW